MAITDKQFRRFIEQNPSLVEKWEGLLKFTPEWALAVKAAIRLVYKNPKLLENVLLIEQLKQVSDGLQKATSNMQRIDKLVALSGRPKLSYVLEEIKEQPVTHRFLAAAIEFEAAEAAFEVELYEKLQKMDDDLRKLAEAALEETA